MTSEAADPLRVRKPPPGLDKDERRDWREEEAQRIADLQDQARTGGFSAVRPTAPPKGLGGSGRAAWREADRDNRARRLDAEAAGTESDRYVGALILMVLIGVVVAVRVMVSGGTDQPVQPVPPPAPAVVSTHIVPHIVPSPRGE